MNFLKRIFIYFIIVLFIWSVKYDLSNKNMNIDSDNESRVINDKKQENTAALEVIKYQFDGHGDTMLSITEKLNGGSIPVSTEQVIIDFRTANSNIDPYRLQPGAFYYFPKYKKAAP